MCILTDVFDLDLTDALDLDLTGNLTAVKGSVTVLCNLHTREMLLSFLAAAPLPLCTAPLLLCSAAQVQLVWLCNHWVRLHSCTLPVLPLQAAPQAGLGLAWVEEFKLSLSLELAWFGYLGLGTLNKKNSANCPNSPLVHVFPPSWRKEWTNVQVF